MGHNYLDALETGQEVISFYILNRAQIRKGKSTEYIEFELQDRTGLIRAVLWQGDNAVFYSLKPGEVAKVRAEVTEYNGRQELHIKQIRMAEVKDEVDYSELIESTPRNVENLIEEFEAYINNLQDPFIQKLITNLFADENFRKKYYTAPAGKKWHHCYKHGLLEHVVNMLTVGKIVCGFYPDIFPDLLTAGIILHDIGKIWEYESEIAIDFTDFGRLNGHIAIGYHLIMTEIDKIADFPDFLREQIGHLILSHQGALEKASPVVPMTLEAIVLHYLDEMDAETNAISRVIKKDFMPGSNWTRFNQLMNRFFYTGREYHPSAFSSDGIDTK